MNLFDQEHEQLNGYDSSLGELDGLFKSLRKIGRKIDKARRKIGRKLDKSGFNKIAGAVALAVVGGPAAAGLLKKGAAAGGALLKSKTAASLAAKAVASKVQAKTAQAQAQAQQQALEETQRAQQVAANLASVMASNSGFAKAVSKYRSMGYSDEQIYQHWLESKAFYVQAVETVQQAIKPQIERQVRVLVRNPKIADKVAEDVSLVEADKAVKKVQAENSGLAKMAIPASIAALLLLV